MKEWMEEICLFVFFCPAIKAENQKRSLAWRGHGRGAFRAFLLRASLDLIDYRLRIDTPSIEVTLVRQQVPRVMLP